MVRRSALGWISPKADTDTRILFRDDLKKYEVVGKEAVHSGLICRLPLWAAGA
jgi:hypothetical protein